MSRTQRYAGSTIMQIAFNKRAPTCKDPAITRVRHFRAHGVLTWELTWRERMGADAGHQRDDDQDGSRWTLPGCVAALVCVFAEVRSGQS